MFNSQAKRDANKANSSTELYQGQGRIDRLNRPSQSGPVIAEVMLDSIPGAANCMLEFPISDAKINIDSRVRVTIEII